MILIFGGTTEGRIAVEVCEQAEGTFYYSTKSSLQQVELQHGIRLSGAMTEAEMQIFCTEHDIKCIVDAAHPFAENLHRTIAKMGLPVVRLQRVFDQKITGVTYCTDYAGAIEKMRQDGVRKLLALTGTNTIVKLREFWQKTPTFFRILNRKESIDAALESGFKPDNLLFYSELHNLPTQEEEMKLMNQVGCDAIITKESGESGGYEQKVNAALQLGLKVYVVQRPSLPAEWTYVTGKIGLRKAIEQFVPGFFPLKTGFTTGACATAATKAALISLLYDESPETIDFSLPDGEIMSIPVQIEQKGVASVVKDFSDDPDVTRGCKITSMVALTPGNEIKFLQGKGVGVVTLPGLGIPVNGPAVNPTPRAMIEAEIRQLTESGCDVTISVENGEELAKRTFNYKVGVEGGISIIGTSGIVYPLSNEAFLRSLRREFEVAKAIGCTEIGLVSGKKGETALRQQSDIRCIHYGNFVGEALSIAKELGFHKVVVGIMIGKAVKLAEGNMNTHSHKVQMNKEFLKTLAGPDADKIDHINMARDLWTCMPQSFFDKITERCYAHCRNVFNEGDLIVKLICDDQV